MSVSQFHLFDKNLKESDSIAYQQLCFSLLVGPYLRVDTRIINFCFLISGCLSTSLATSTGHQCPSLAGWHRREWQISFATYLGVTGCESWNPLWYGRNEFLGLGMLNTFRIDGFRKIMIVVLDGFWLKTSWARTSTKSINILQSCYKSGRELVWVSEVVVAGRFFCQICRPSTHVWEQP